MEDNSKLGQVKQQVAGQSMSSHFDQIAPHRRDQHAAAPNRPTDGFAEGKPAPQQ